MAAIEPGKIRNVAVVGHRGTGKTSLVEALLYQTDEINRLGAIDAGTTVSDWDEDEQKRRMSISLTLAHTNWQDRKINLLDVPGDPSFQGEARCALRVVEGALVVVNAVMGLEVGTARVKHLADELGLARVLFVNMLDRERADFYRTLDADPGAVLVALRRGAPADRRRARDLGHRRRPPHVRLHEPERRQGGRADARSRTRWLELAQEYREKLLDEVVQTDEALMEQYLGGEELDPHAVASALKLAITRGEVFPVACGVATKNLGTHALLDLIVEGVPSPAKKGAPIEIEGADTAAFVFKTVADPFAGRINLFRVLKGAVTADSTLVDARGHAKERMGTLLQLQGKGNTGVREFGEGDIGAVAKLKDVRTGDLLTDREIGAELPEIAFPEPVMSFAITPRVKGEEEKVATAIRRLAEEDPTLRLRRDQQTGEEILSGMSQMHVEVALERAKRRYGVDVELHPPRVPYLETIRSEARAHGRYKKQTGGRGQFGDCHIVIEPIDGGVGYEFVDKIVGGVIPQSFRPAVDKGIQEAMAHGELAGAPGAGRARAPRRRLVPQRRLVRDGVQGRRLDGLEGRLRARDADAARADHGARGDGARRGRRLGQRRSQLAARAAARDGAGGRDDDDQGRGADGRAPHLRAVAHLDDGRPRRVLDALPPLRGGAVPRRPEGDRGDAEVPRSRPCLSG